MAASKPKLVIVGAGFGGLTLAQALADRADVKLVDGKSFLEIIWAGVRAPVEPQLADVSVVPYTELPKIKDCIVHAKATGVSSTHVQLSTGQELPYDYLVLSFGASYSDKLICTTEGSASDRRAQYKEANRKLSSARSALVIGGGPLGVELAAEIKGGMPEKRVTLVQSGPVLLAGQPARMSARALSSLRSQGVEVILDDKASEVEGRPGTYRLHRAGTELQADVAYFTSGIRPFSGWLRGQHSDVLDPAGFVKVDECFRVAGRANWFALGDCCSIPDWKMGLQAKLQAEELLKTFDSILKVGPEQAVYHKHKPFCGMKDACANMFGWTIMPWFIVVSIKSKDLLIGKTRSDFGLPKVPLPVAQAA